MSAGGTIVTGPSFPGTLRESALGAEFVSEQAHTTIACTIFPLHHRYSTVPNLLSASRRDLGGSGAAASPPRTHSLASLTRGGHTPTPGVVDHGCGHVVRQAAWSSHAPHDGFVIPGIGPLWYHLPLCTHGKLFPDRIVIKELWTYPIKSCAGVKLESARMHRGGLQWDREFAIIDMREETSGQVLSQKTYPKLANLWPVLHCTEASPSGKGQLPCTPSSPSARLDGITLHEGDPNGQSNSSVHVDLNDKGGEKACRSTWVGNSTPLDAIRYPAADTWLAAFLGFPSSLCRLTSRRDLRTTRLAPVADLTTDCCRYQDGAPLTILSEASVDAVRRRFRPHKLSACRFRPNVLIDGCGALEESTWARVTVGGAEDEGDSTKPAVGIRMLMDAYRCTMVTIVQAPEAVSGVVEAGSRPRGRSYCP